MAIGAESVQGWDAERAGEIAVRPAACFQILQIKADFGGQTFGMVEQFFDALELFIRRAIDAAGNRDRARFVIRFEAFDICHHFGSRVHVGDADINADLAVFGHDIGQRAAGNNTDRAGLAFIVIGQRFEFNNNFRHFMNRRMTVHMAHTRMCRHTFDVDFVL